MTHQFVYRVEVKGRRTWLYTPWAIYGLDEDADGATVYPMEEWRSQGGGPAYFTLTMPDGKMRRFVNYPYELDVDNRQQEAW